MMHRSESVIGFIERLASRTQGQKPRTENDIGPGVVSGIVQAVHAKH